MSQRIKELSIQENSNAFLNEEDGFHISLSETITRGGKTLNLSMGVELRAFTV